MSKRIIISLVLIVLMGCSSKVVNVENPNTNIVKYLLVVEGVNIEVSQSLLTSLRKMEPYVRDSVLIIKDGYMQATFRFYFNPNIQKDIYTRLNNIFMANSIDVSISATIDSFSVKSKE